MPALRAAASAAAVLLTVAGCGVGRLAEPAAKIDMAQAALRADAMLRNTLAAIAPGVEWQHNTSNHVHCTVFRRAAVTTVIAPERSAAFVAEVERVWRASGYEFVLANPKAPAVYFKTSEGFQIRVLFGYANQPHFEVATPCVTKSSVPDPFSSAGVAPYSGTRPPLPDRPSDFWSSPAGGEAHR